MRLQLIMKFVEMAFHWRCTSVCFSIRTPARDGRPRVRGRLVGRSVGGIKFLTLFRCAGSLGRRAFQAVGSAKCVISASIPRWRTLQHPRSTPVGYL